MYVTDRYPEDHGKHYRNQNFGIVIHYCCHFTRSRRPLNDVQNVGSTIVVYN